MNRKLVFVIVFLIVTCTGSIFLIKPNSGLTLDDDIKIGLYYYVWYEEGNNTRHWNDEPCDTAVDRPVLGYYSSQDRTVIKQHLDWMKDIGIDFLIISWWGKNSYEDNSTKVVFETVNSYASDWMELAILVEGFNEIEGPHGYDFAAIYDYLLHTYMEPYSDIYLRINNKPLACWYNFPNMTNPEDNQEAIRNDSRFEARIVGHSNYVDWWAWPIAGYDEAPEPLCTDEYVGILPRYDDTYLNRSTITKYDVNLTEGLYDKQWNKTISLAREGEVNFLAIYSWNEYHERSQIEPHISMDYTYILSLFCQTKYYVQIIPEFLPTDATPPIIHTLSPKNKTYTAKDVSLTFTVSESTSWIGYSLDGQANVTIARNTTISGLSDGSHGLTVYSKDTAGNTGASKTIYFTIDTKQPEPFPIWVVGVAIATVAIASAAIAVFWRRRKQPP